MFGGSRALLIPVRNKQKEHRWHTPWANACLHEGVGPGCLICGLQAPGWWADLAVGQWELNFGIVKLLGVLTLAERYWNSCSLNDLDARGTHPMARSHLIVHLLHCSIESQISVLLVHVVVASPALIAHPDTIVLDGGGVLLKNLIDGQELTVRLLDLLQLSEEVPKLRLSAHFVGGP